MSTTASPIWDSVVRRPLGMSWMRQAVVVPASVGSNASNLVSRSATSPLIFAFTSLKTAKPLARTSQVSVAAPLPDAAAGSWHFATSFVWAALAPNDPMTESRRPIATIASRCLAGRRMLASPGVVPGG